MKNQSLEFITLNYQTIYYLNVDGEPWVPIEPLCEVLGLNLYWHLNMIVADTRWGTLYRTFDIKTPGGKDETVFCLPVMVMYGWLIHQRPPLAIEPEAEKDWAENTRQWYDKLFEHFRSADLTYPSLKW